MLNLTNKPKEQVEAIIAALKNVKNINVSAFIQHQGRTIGLSIVSIFIMKLFNLINIVGRSFEAKIALMLIVARITLQSSRLQALYWSKKEDVILDLLNFTKEQKDNLDKHSIYTGLDYLIENQKKIENKLFRAYYGKNTPKRLYYDVTSSYVEGKYTNSQLVDYGYNRDKKKGKSQIVVGLLTDENGHAVSIDTYPGNTNDIKTFANQLDKIKHRFKLDNITIIGDGGMIKSKDIVKIKELGYDYITSIGKSSIRKLLNNNVIDASLFDEEVQETVVDDVRYVIKRNPFRVEEIQQTRKSKMDKLSKFVNTRQDYYNTHYRARKETLQRNINKRLQELKLDTFVYFDITYKEGNITITDKDNNTITKTKELASVEIVIDKAALQEIETLDGCYAIKTSLTNTDTDTKESIHKAYKTLSKVENAFKVLKTDFLDIRPLYLKTDNRIKAHIFLSMLAYNVTLQLKQYTDKVNLDFKSTIRRLNVIKTVLNKINKHIYIETIPHIDEELQKLFDVMKLKMPNRI